MTISNPYQVERSELEKMIRSTVKKFLDLIVEFNRVNEFRYLIETFIQYVDELPITTYEILQSRTKQVKDSYKYFFDEFHNNLFGL